MADDDTKAPPPPDPSNMDALKQRMESRKPKPAPPAAKPRTPAPSRDGLVTIAGHFPAEMRRALKVAAAEQDKSLAEVMDDAFKLYLAKRQVKA